MTFRNRLQYFLVKRLQISNKKAIELITLGECRVAGKQVFENVEIQAFQEIAWKGEILREEKRLHYIAFYKPVGIETTLNQTIPDNLQAILPFEEKLFPVGRLDKASEGLLLLSNDGRLFDKTLRKEHQTEKEYIVKVDKPITESFILQMSSGITIMGQTTLPCSVEALDEHTFSIILVQGLNRQIRRMCYKLDYEVLSLKRIRIDQIHLGDLQPNEYREVGELIGEL
ncbi:pseudouridine synthase [Flectobacillus sp. DC10W]|uniref:Pseudouridine synthase n=1 Tax=Flectobacillus longus TaxID=2984207 RepID=A0ABT6YMC0_9BACT|nr:pseudouridine synthase [Flectobacillus longus]MDI9864579.1 pseudouridine synthase [Flectobacillus longus]